MKKIRKLVLSNPFLREIFFTVTKRKINMVKIEKKILKLNRVEYERKNKIDDIVVSLTSYGERVKELSYTLYSLVAQSIRPYKIIVYLTEQDFNRLSKKELLFTEYGVEYHITEDLKSYKKLIPAISEFPNCSIITADDDLFYPRKWLENLYKDHLLYPNCVICHQFIEITYDKIINSFDKWIINPNKENISKTYCILGGSGTLYPKEGLYKDYNNYELIKELAPTADDIYFYFMAILKGTSIKQVRNHWKQLRYVNVYREYGIKPGETLTQLNVGNNRNDIQFQNILKHYGINDEKLIAYYKSEIKNLI